jgi:hypothetical protein
MGQPLPGYDIVQYAGKWWLVGFVGGDQALPQTGGCHTVNEALDAAESWLVVELQKGAKK